MYEILNRLLLQYLWVNSFCCLRQEFHRGIAEWAGPVARSVAANALILSSPLPVILSRTSPPPLTQHPPSTSASRALESLSHIISTPSSPLFCPFQVNWTCCRPSRSLPNLPAAFAQPHSIHHAPSHLRCPRGLPHHLVVQCIGYPLRCPQRHVQGPIDLLCPPIRPVDLCSEPGLGRPQARYYRFGALQHDSRQEGREGQHIIPPIAMPASLPAASFVNNRTGYPTRRGRCGHDGWYQERCGTYLGQRPSNDNVKCIY
jgi:hypothetical protein